MMEFAGYVASMLVGISLGLTGAGGGILTVPIMLFLFRLPHAASVSYTMFVVSATSLIGCVLKYRQREVVLNIACVFGIVSTVAIIITKQFLIPVIPKYIHVYGHRYIEYSHASMILFALIMLSAAFPMIRSSNRDNSLPNNMHGSIYGLILSGITVGTLTALLGAGGGFLIIPALMLFFSLDIKMATGTSLAVIFINGLVGFVMDVTRSDMDWSFLLKVTSITVTGIYIGVLLAGKLNSRILKTSFGWFVMLLGIVILIKEAVILRACLIFIETPSILLLSL